MIFGALSNAAYRVSLHGPGAEIEGGGSQEPPPSGGGKSRGPSGRGLIYERLRSLRSLRNKSGAKVHCD